MPPSASRYASDPLWYKDAIIYETHVKAFYDKNGDGIGDLAGLVEKLDYLQGLGITCLWLLPFYPSPLRDDGYDIADYRNIHQAYGTVEEFRRLVDAAHERDIAVLVELVVNHTSDQHPWFQRARRAAPGEPERDFYVWSATDQKFEKARIIFTDTEKSNWTWDAEAKAYYWHRFFSHQPDLNFDNPRVLEQMLQVLEHWAEMGVDGFRLDAVPYLVERDGTSCENLPETHEVIRKIRARLDARYPGRMLLAEANQWPRDVRPYFGNGDECHMAFHFPLMPRIFMALRLEDTQPIREIMAETPPIPDSCQWALFLRNHDELTLEMVSADERDYMYLAYSREPRARLNVGIRRRLAPLLQNSRPRIELLHSLLFSFPGTPVVYYGDEIGMGARDRPHLRIQRRQRGGPAGGPVLAPALDEEHDRVAEALSGLRAGLDGVPAGLQPQDPRLRASLRGGRHPLRGQHVASGPAGRAEPPGIRGLHPGGDAGLHRVSPHREGAVLPHPRVVRLLLVRAQAPTHGDVSRRALVSRRARGDESRPAPPSSCSSVFASRGPSPPSPGPPDPRRATQRGRCLRRGSRRRWRRWPRRGRGGRAPSRRPGG
jgi:trehalose synthase